MKNKNDLKAQTPAFEKPSLAAVRSSLKSMILNWVKTNHNEFVELSHIKQTNISFRDNLKRDTKYYFECGSWISPYTMKRWVEIAENNIYDTWTCKHGTWYWIKDKAVIV